MSKLSPNMKPGYKDPIFLTILALGISTLSDKISELTSLPQNAVLVISCLILIIPLYIWISSWLKHRKNK